MIKYIENLGIEDNIIGFQISGTVDKKSVDEAIRLLDEKLSQGGQTNLYLEIPASVSTIKLGAIWDSLKYFLNHLLKYLFGVRRIAVVTDQKLLQALTKLEDKLLVGIEERVFTTEEKDTAINWLKEDVAKES